MKIPLQARHQPSGFNVVFHDLSFADYVAATRDMLIKAHAGAADLEKIVEGNAPFELRPPVGFPTGQKKTYQRGVLLIHGLTDSPYFMRHLAGFFQRSGFRVMAILLPGHGTQPGDLLNIQWQQWTKTVAYGIEQLNSEVDEIYLAGFSLGGALSIYHSLTDTRVNGLFLFSPALKISPKAAYANWHKFYSWLAPSSKWLSICPDRDIYKYESVAKQAIAQTWALIRELDSKLQQKIIDIPVFAAASMEDATVDTSSTVEFIGRAPYGHLVLYSANAQTADSPTIEIVNSVIPEQRILCFSHPSVVIPETDPHYGISGDYCSCHHYYPLDMEKYTACIEHPEQAAIGELTSSNLETGLLRRLTYNPKFERLETAMQQFIENLP